MRQEGFEEESRFQFDQEEFRPLVIKFDESMNVESMNMEEMIAQIKKLESIAGRSPFGPLDQDTLLEEIRLLYEQVRLFRPAPASATPPGHRQEVKPPMVGMSEEKTESPTTSSPEAPKNTPLPKPSQTAPTPALRPKPQQVYEPGAAALAHPPTFQQSESNRAANRDIRHRISLNEGFGFIQDLFSGQVDQYHRVLDKINQFEDYASALQWIEEQVHDPLGWKDEDPAVQSFYALLAAQFPNPS